MKQRMNDFGLAGRSEEYREGEHIAAGISSRFMAMLIDLAVCGILLSGGLIIAGSHVRYGNTDVMSVAVMGLTAGLLVMAGPFLLWGYFIFLHGLLGQTVGKMLLGLKLVTFEGLDVTYGAAFLRSTAFLVSLLPFGAGLLWALFDRKGLALHDYLSVTKVICTARSGHS